MRHGGIDDLLLRGMPFRHEVATLAIANTLVVALAGWIADKDLLGTIVVASMVGATTYVLGKRLTDYRPRREQRLTAWPFLAVVVAIPLGLVIGVYASLREYPWPSSNLMAPNYASSGRTMQLSPCPFGLEVGPGPAGTHVCYSTVVPTP